MASYVFYPGDGTQTDWSVPFPYLAKDHVKVYANGIPVAFSWLNSALIRVSPAVALGSTMVLQRVTQKTPMTVFENTNNLTAENLTLAETQALFIAEEASDRASLSISIDDASGQYSFSGRRATNVGDPINDQDVATKHWAETAMSSQLAVATTAKDTAVANAVLTNADRAAVAADRVSVGAWRDLVSGWKDTVSGWKDTIEGWKNTIEGWRTDVATWRDAAGNSMTAAQSAKASAEAARDVATGKATAASTSAANARTSEVNAASSAAEAAASAGSINASNILTKGGNLAGLTDKAAARSNLDVSLTVPLPAACNFNTAIKPGAFFTSDISSTNAPVAGFHYYLLVESYGTSPADYVKQTATRLDTSGDCRVWVRTRDVNGWGAWRVQLAAAATYAPSTVGLNILAAASGDAAYTAMGASRLTNSRGYQKFPSGLIIQWGNGTNASSQLFPVGFPGACLGLVASVMHNTNSASINATTTAPDQYGFSLFVTYATAGGVGAGGETAFWFAYGY